MRATVCLPTYDERANLERMVRALQPVLRDGDRVLVIDDNSPDGTGAIADSLAVELPFVPCCTGRSRKASGLPISQASGRRSTTTQSSWSRWTATSRTTRPTCPA